MRAFRLLLPACLLPRLGAGAPAGGPGVEEARVAVEGGVPRLMLDGRPTVPFIFFYNTDIGGPERDHLLPAQVALARDAGCHIYSLPLRVPRLPDSDLPNFDWPDRLLDRFIAVDPDALFLVRVYPGPNQTWKLWAQFPSDEVAAYADGSPGANPSLASPTYQRRFAEDLRAIIRHYEGSPYGRRIIAYQPGGPEHEMFGDQYRERGPDLSPVNQQGFRRWLKRRYGAEAALKQAWQRPEVTLATATIPVPEAGRFPMHGEAEPIRVFYDLPVQRDWVDFSGYANDLAADCILAWARLIKEETGGRRLSAFFYGYTMELVGSFSGHYAAQRVLECPDVDILAGPCSYTDRRAGAPPSFMSLVDSIAAHGKLWFNEDDMRTSFMAPALLPAGGHAFNQPITTRDREETLAVLDRNFAAIQLHRAGTWWMDLMSAGAFSDPSAWRMLSRRLKSYRRQLDRPTPYRAEVAIVVDERSKEFVRSDWDACHFLMLLRTAAGKCGLPVAWYALNDVISGVAPPCRVYVFASAFQLDDAPRRALARRLRSAGATAIWVYASGVLGPDGPDARRAGHLVGMDVAIHRGKQGSEGCGILTGETWGTDREIVPRLVVEDTAAEPLGHYRSDGLVSTARLGRNVFVGDAVLTPDLLRKLFAAAGAHVWATGGEVIQCDGRLLCVHAAEAGEHRVSLPPGVEAQAIEADVARVEGDAVVLRFPRDATQWLRLVPRR